MTSIKLTQNWILGARIGSGGFGQVFAAENEDGLKAAVKLVPKAPGADRELLFVDLKGVRGIVPVIDSGEHGDHWVLVMPRADESLRQHLMGAAEPIQPAAATVILIDLTSALAELDGKVVHRDYLGSHKAAALRKLIRAVGARLWYLPPYSPDLNPIEQTFAKIKHWMRSAQKRTVDDICQHIGSLVTTISPAECSNYFENAGYASIKT